MGKPTGFLEYQRKDPLCRPVAERIKDYVEIYLPMSKEEIVLQAARCMDCGVPFCHGAGCPVANIIPEFNELVYRGQWRDANMILHNTNNFPEITGRVCPALCEAACVASIHNHAVAIRNIELAIVEHSFQQGWIQPQKPSRHTGKSVAVIGSGPAGLACAQQLNRVGHKVAVFEQKDRLGGLLRYGIPDFKLDKGVLDRRLRILETEGIEFHTQVRIGVDVSVSYLLRCHDALCLAGGARKPRDLEVPGRDLKGIHFAMDYLEQSNRRVAGQPIPASEEISAAGKRVVVIGGGDTGADCVGTANRQGADLIHQLEILPKPPVERGPDQPWPNWPFILRTSSSHEEGCSRRWSVMTKAFSGKDGRVARLHGVEISFSAPGQKGQPTIEEIPGSEFELETDLILLAMGFVHPEYDGVIQGLGVALDKRGNVAVDQNMMSSVERAFSAGDMTMGSSLVVHAISQGRKAAQGIDSLLMGGTVLF